MGGSRKGERRGGKRAGMEPHTLSKAGAIKAEHHEKHRAAPRRTEEYYRDIVRAMSDSADPMDTIEPRDVMLNIMRDFYRDAHQEKQLLTSMVEQLPNIPDDSPMWATYSEMLETTKTRKERLQLMAMDAAFKVAPYTHARLSSVEMTGPDKQPLDIINVLMIEINNENRGRPNWLQEVEQGEVIEHEPHIGEET